MRSMIRPYLHGQRKNARMSKDTHTSFMVSGKILRSSKISYGSRDWMVSSTILA
jgi:hypothetical protein